MTSPDHAASDGDHVLVTRGLAVHYGQKIALRDVDLNVKTGEMVALVGRNGAGKSSLLSALAGACRYHGDLNWRLRDGEIAYVPQRAHPRWDMPLSVRQVVGSGRLRGRRWWRRPDAQDRIAVVDALDRMGLTDLANRPVQRLSGGQAQRVLLARALAQQPKALLLDEPYDGLDKTTVTALNAQLAGLSARGVAVIAAVHELAVVRDTYQRVVALDGHVIADGNPDEVFSPAGLGRLFGIEIAA
jgi:manganese/iron transport system ATP-binding protein